MNFIFSDNKDVKEYLWGKLCHLNLYIRFNRSLKNIVDTSYNLSYDKNMKIKNIGFWHFKIPSDDFWHSEKAKVS